MVEGHRRAAVRVIERVARALDDYLARAARFGDAEGMSVVSRFVDSELDALAVPQPTVVVRMGGADDVGPLPVIHHRPRMHTLPGLGDEDGLSVWSEGPCAVDELLELSDPGRHLVTAVRAHPPPCAPERRLALSPIHRAPPRTSSLWDLLSDAIRALSSALSELFGLQASPSR